MYSIFNDKVIYMFLLFSSTYNMYIYQLSRFSFYGFQSVRLSGRVYIMQSTTSIISLLLITKMRY